MPQKNELQKTELLMSELPTTGPQKNDLESLKRLSFAWSYGNSIALGQLSLLKKQS